MTELLAVAKALNEELMNKVDNFDEKVLSYLAAQASTCLAPMCAVIGGIVAQEVMKVRFSLCLSLSLSLSLSPRDADFFYSTMSS